MKLYTYSKDFTAELLAKATLLNYNSKATVYVGAYVLFQDNFHSVLGLEANSKNPRLSYKFWDIRWSLCIGVDIAAATNRLNTLLPHQLKQNHTPLPRYPAVTS